MVIAFAVGATVGYRQMRNCPVIVWAGKYVMCAISLLGIKVIIRTEEKERRRLSFE
jgi:hypothetical protein